MFSENEQLIEQPTQEVAAQEQAPVNQEQNSPSDQNWRLLRDRAEAAERRAAQLEYERNLELQRRQPVHNEPEEEFNVEDDTYIEGRQLKKYVRSLKNEIDRIKKDAEVQTERMRNDMAINTLKAQYKDFSQVVNEQSLQELQRRSPSLFDSIARNPDMYKRGEGLYELLKHNAPSQNSYYAPKPQEVAKPKSAAGIGATPSQSPLVKFTPGERRELSEDYKAEVRRRVEQSKMLSY